MKTWTREEIDSLLMRNDHAVERALITLYNRQTADEQRAHDTKYLNRRGFTSGDAEFMTAWALQVLNGKPLSERQVAFLRHGRRIRKYLRQLTEEANLNEEKRNAQTQAAA